jgi:putative restriction endonuclease
MGAAEQVTERLLVAAARIGQHRFAKEVLGNCGHRCVFCGLRPGSALDRKGLLIASHIKPWRVSSARERLDSANGLAACPSHDVALDGGLLWVNGGLQIHAAAVLDSARQLDSGLAASFGSLPSARASSSPRAQRRQVANT